MKNKKLLLRSLVLGTICLFLTADTFAGHNEGRRSGCRWWRKRFWAEAHLYTSIRNLGLSYDRGCEWAQAYKTAVCIAPNVFAEAFARADHNRVWGFVKRCDAWQGAKHSELYDKINSNYQLTEETGLDCNKELQEVQFSPEFGLNSISISNVSIKLKSCSNSLFENKWNLSIWLPRDDFNNFIEDTVMTDEKILRKFSVTIKNGEVIFDGDIFSPNEFEIKNDGAFITVNYIGNNKTIQLSNVNIDDVAINSNGDIQDNEQDLFKKSTSINDSKFKDNISTTIYPVPSQRYLNIEFSKNNVELNEIEVYDMNGKSVFKKVITERSNVLNIDISNLTKGTYFIYLNGNNFKALKQFIKD